MLAPAAAPSTKRVTPSRKRLVVAAVRMTAMAPKTGPHCITRCAPRRSERTPKPGDRISSATK